MLFFFNYRKNNIYVTIFVILIISIAGLRDMIGGFDVYIYAEVYEKLQGLHLFLYPHFEKGYLVYYYLLQKIDTSREFMFFFTALLMTVLHFYTIKKLTPNLGMSLFIYFCKFFLFSFVYLRQGLAMGIIWLGISFLIQKKYWWVILFSILAFTFHKSSIIMFPFLLISNWKLKTHQLGLIAFLILFISITPLSNLMFGFLADVAESEKASLYVQKTGGINPFYLVEGVVGVYLSVTFQKYFYKKRVTKVILNGFFLYSIIILAGLTNATFIRFSWYYFIFVVLALPYIYYFYKLENFEFKSLFKNLIYVYYSMVFFRLLIFYDGGDFMPYKTIYQDWNRNGIWEFMEYRK